MQIDLSYGQVRCDALARKESFDLERERILIHSCSLDKPGTFRWVEMRSVTSWLMIICSPTK